MTIYLLIAIPLATGVIAWSVGLKPTALLAGSGSRRFTRASASDLLEDIRTLKQQLAEAQRPKACPNCHYLPGSGMPTDAELAESDRSDPAPRMAAPAGADIGVRSAPLAAAETVKDSFLEQLAQPGEEHMVAELRAKAAAPAKAPVPPEADTQRLPAVAAVRPLQTLQAEELAAWALGTAPSGTQATEALPDASALAAEKVAAATTVGAA